MTSDAHSLSARLEHRIRRDFLDPEPVVARLAALEPPLAEKQSRERIIAAVVLLGHGDPASLEHAARLAERDWRDVLVAAGLASGDWEQMLDSELGPD